MVNLRLLIHVTGQMQNLYNINDNKNDIILLIHMFFFKIRNSSQYWHPNDNLLPQNFNYSKLTSQVLNEKIPKSFFIKLLWSFLFFFFRQPNNALSNLFFMYGVHIGNIKFSIKTMVICINDVISKSVLTKDISIWWFT